MKDDVANLNEVSAPTVGGMRPALWIDAEGFITDGAYKCPHRKGRYTIGIFRNPSGDLRPRLKGYRPKNGAGQKDGTADGGSAADRRVRENDFDSLQEADAARDALIVEDSNSTDDTRLVRTRLSVADVRNAEAAKDILVTLPDRDAVDTKWDFKRSAEYVQQHYKRCETKKPLAEAIDAYVKMKDKVESRAGSTLERIELNLKRLNEACLGKMVHEVPPEVLMPLIYRGETVGEEKDITLGAMKSNKSTYVNFFDWCAAPPRKWTPSNPAKDIPLPDREDEEAVPEILPNPVVEAFFRRALVFKGGRLFLFLCCACACALRPTEMARIEALLKILGVGSFFFSAKEDENLIKAIGKRRRRRPVIIPIEFVPFIKVFVEAGYPVIPRNFKADWTVSTPRN